jgi:hypothetical protein
MDNRPFPDLRHIVRDAADDRIDVFAEWVSSSIASRVSQHPVRFPLKRPCVSHALLTGVALLQHQAAAGSVGHAQPMLLLPLTSSAMCADLSQVPTENC